ncbi:hypothetical protein H0H92_008506 [Tricholoma furcatifolium]|nr:hypothetical protein H0H92_008506 [Tricholoma furcatifolium]
MTEAQSDLDFPRDLFYPILWYVKNLPYLWSLRQVSRDFADAVEKVFLHKHMNKTWLVVDFGMTYTRETKLHLAYNFDFDRMDPQNPSRVIFSEKDCAEEYRPIVIKKLRSEMEYGNFNFHDPKFQVQIRRDLNDTTIPGLEFDYEKLEASFEWKGLYSAFFREEAEISRRMRLRVESMKSELLAVKERVERGEVSQMEMVEMMVMGFSNSNDDIRKAVRRERICREIWEKEGVKWEWTNEDARSLKELKEARWMLGMGEPYSDESDGEGGRDREDEEEDMDEDEYEDEDGMDEDEYEDEDDMDDEGNEAD